MARMESLELVRSYYQALGSRDPDRFLSLLSPDVVHQAPDGSAAGRPAFGRLLARMAHAGDEDIVDLVVMATDDGRHAAAAYVVEPRGQPRETERRPAHSFFEVVDGRIVRVTDAPLAGG